MALVEVNTKKLTRPLAWLIASLALATLISWLTHSVKQSQRSTYDLARDELELQRSEFRAAVEAGSILQTSQQRYADLEQRSFVGEEQRLLWVESLRNQGENQKLFDLRYEISQQQMQSASGNEYFELYASQMQLHLELSHEGKLVSFLQGLNSEKSAIYQLQGCTMNSNIKLEGLRMDAPNIQADCNLVWYTVRPKKHSTTDGMNDA